MARPPSYAPPLAARLPSAPPRLSGEPVALAGATMGTTWSARLALPPGVTRQQAQAAIAAALDEVVAQMSTWEAGSDISRFNRAATGWQALPEALFHVLSHALDLADASGGAYDPTIGALVDAWGFGAGPRVHEPPAAAAIAAALTDCGHGRVRLDAQARRAWQPGGVRLDLSSIAKGYGVDRAALALRALGVTACLVEVGGELRAHGARPDGLPWRVAVEVPDASGAHALAVPLRDQSIATSGDYRRYIEQAGRRYAHTLDPRTGKPLDNDLASVTVIHPECMLADGLATALGVLGAAAGADYAARHDLAALFILRGAAGHEVRATPAFAALLDRP